jgi:hypothetical protein
LDKNIQRVAFSIFQSLKRIQPHFTQKINKQVKNENLILYIQGLGRIFCQRDAPYLTTSRGHFRE